MFSRPEFGAGVKGENAGASLAANWNPVCPFTSSRNVTLSYSLSGPKGSFLYNCVFVCVHVVSVLLVKV